jgi:AcrR family transcriptional regulator
MRVNRQAGEELETALLEAAWNELAEAGFARLTMESVGARAKTGVAVLYRRWPRKDDLVLAAIQHYGKTRPVDVPDTGSLRGDMLVLMEADVRQPLVAIISAVFAGLLARNGSWRSSTTSSCRSPPPTSRIAKRSRRARGCGRTPSGLS